MPPQEDFATTARRLGGRPTGGSSAPSSPNDPFAETARRLGGRPLRPIEPEPVEEEGTLFGRFVTDPAISLARGLADVPAAALGIADLATGGYAGKLVEDYTPWNPQAVDEYLQSGYTPEQKQAFENVRRAEGFLDNLGAVISNPSVIPHAIFQTLPGMYGGGAAGAAAVRGAGAFAKPLVRAGLGADRVRRAGTAIAGSAGAIGEGAYAAGSSAEHLRQQDPERTLGARGTLAALATGAGTTAFGIGGQKLGKAMGLDVDIDQRIAESMGARSLREVVDEAVKAGPRAEISAARQIVSGFIQEGAFEELPQSVYEQVMSNWAQGKDLMDGVAAAAVLGTVVGGVMGAGFQAGNRYMNPPEPKAEAEAELPPPPPPDDEAVPPPTPEGPLTQDEAELRDMPEFLEQLYQKEEAERKELEEMPAFLEDLYQKEEVERRRVEQETRESERDAAIKRWKAGQLEEQELRTFLEDLYQQEEGERQFASGLKAEEVEQELRRATAERIAEEKELRTFLETLYQQEEGERQLGSAVETEARIEQHNQRLAAAQQEERELSEFLDALYQKEEAGRKRKAEEDFLTEFSKRSQAKFEAAQPPTGVPPTSPPTGVPPTMPPTSVPPSSVPPTSVPPTGVPPITPATPPVPAGVGAAPPVTESFVPEGPDLPVDRSTPVDAPDVVKGLVQAAKTFDPQVNPKLIKKTYDERVAQAEAQLADARPGRDEDTGIVALAKAIAAAGGWNEIDRAPGNRYFNKEKRSTGEIQALKDAAATTGYGNAGSFGSMAGVPGVFRKKGLPTDQLLQALQRQARDATDSGMTGDIIAWSQFKDANDLQEYVLRELVKPSPKAGGRRRLTLNDLRIDPNQQWWVPSHLRGLSRIARAEHQARTADTAEMFDTDAMETPPPSGPPSRSEESRWDVKRGKFTERPPEALADPPPLAQSFPQSVFDSLHESEWDLLVQLQEADTLDESDRAMLDEYVGRVREAIDQAGAEARRADEAVARDQAAADIEYGDEDETVDRVGVTIREGSKHAGKNPQEHLEYMLDLQRQRDAEMEAKDEEVKVAKSAKKQRLIAEFHAISKVIQDGWQDIADTFDGIDIDALRDEVEKAPKEGQPSYVRRPAGVERADMREGRRRRNWGNWNKLEDALSPEAQKALDIAWAEPTNNRDLQIIRAVMQEYESLVDGTHAKTLVTTGPIVKGKRKETSVPITKADVDAAAKAIVVATENYFLNKPDDPNDPGLGEAEWRGRQLMSGDTDPDRANLSEFEVFVDTHEAAELVWDTVNPRTASFDATEFNTASGAVEFRKRGDTLFPKPSKKERVVMMAKSKGPELKSQAAGKKQIQEWKKYAKGLKKTQDNSNKVVISLFDRTGTWAQPYKDAGYHVITYDIAKGDDLTDFATWMGQIEELVNEGYDIVAVLGAPPCTSYAVSGNGTWNEFHNQPEKAKVRRAYGQWAAQMFDRPIDYANTLTAVFKLIVQQANPTIYAMENPAARIRKQQQLPESRLAFDPNAFGDDYTKGTHIWGEFDAHLPFNRVPGLKEDGGQGSKIHGLSGLDDQLERSETPEGFAYAFFMANHGEKLDKLRDPYGYDTDDPEYTAGKRQSDEDTGVRKDEDDEDEGDGAEGRDYLSSDDPNSIYYNKKFEESDDERDTRLIEKRIAKGLPVTADDADNMGMDSELEGADYVLDEEAGLWTKPEKQKGKPPIKKKEKSEGHKAYLARVARAAEIAASGVTRFTGREGKTAVVEPHPEAEGKFRVARYDIKGKLIDDSWHYRTEYDTAAKAIEHVLGMDYEPITGKPPMKAKAEKAPKVSTIIKLSPTAASFVETEVAELAADPEGHGLDADEARLYKLLAAAVDLKKLTLQVPADAADRDALYTFLNDQSNLYDSMAEGKVEATGTKVEARRFSKVLGELASKINAAPVEKKQGPPIKAKEEPPVTTGKKATGRPPSPALEKFLGNSVVRNEDGSPRVAYHATTADFEEFVPGGKDPRLSGKAIWLGFDKEKYQAAHNVGGYDDQFKQGTSVMPLYVRLENPIVVTDDNRWDLRKQYGLSDGFPKRFVEGEVERLREAGFDGVFDKQSGLKNAQGDRISGDEIAVFSPTQLKSAIGNTGAFDPTSPNIVDRPKGPPIKPADVPLPGDVGKVRDVEVAAPPPIADLPQQGLVLKGEDAPEHMREKPPSLFDQSDKAHADVRAAVSDLFKGFGGTKMNIDPTLVGKLTVKVYNIVKALAKAGYVDAKLVWRHYIEPIFGAASGDLVTAFQVAWRQVHGNTPEIEAKHPPSKTPEERAARLAEAAKDYEQKAQAAEARRIQKAKPPMAAKPVVAAKPPVAAKPVATAPVEAKKSEVKEAPAPTVEQKVEAKKAEPPPPPKDYYDKPPKGPATHPKTGEAIYGMGLTELFELVEDWVGLPRVMARFRKYGEAGAFKAAGEKSGITISADMFEKGNERQLLQVLAHQIGHLIDYLPDYIVKRGNVLGRLLTLKKFIEKNFTKADGTILENKDFRAELLKVSELWRPYNKAKASAQYKAYRNSSRELLADALSALLTDPEMLQANAPNFFREFFDALDRKPDVEQAFNAMQGVMALTPEQRAERRVERRTEEIEEGTKQAVDIEKEKIEKLRTRRWKNWTLRLKQQLLDVNAPVIAVVKKVIASGKEVAEHLDPRYLLQERNYIGGKIKGWLSRNVKPHMERLEENGIKWSHFGLFLEIDRTIKGDYEGKLGPRGRTPATAQDDWDALARKYTPEQMAIVEKSMHAFRIGVQEIVQDAYDAGLYTPEQYKAFKENPAYVTFRGLDFLHENVTAHVHHAKGSAQKVANAADSTILKMMVTIRETQNQKAKRAVFDLIEGNFPDEIERAKRTGESDFARPENRDLEAVGYFDKGVWQRMYVDPLIADSLNNKSVGHNFIVVQAIGYINSKVFRPLFVGYNPGFMMFNVVRDFLRTWKNYNDKGHQLSLAGAIKRYKQSGRLARIRAFGVPKGKMSAKDAKAYSDLTAAEEHFIFGLPFTKGGDRHVQETEVEDILARMQASEAEGPPRVGWRKATGVVSDFFGWMEKVGNFIETLPKAAAMYEMLGDTKTVTDLTPSQTSYLREKIGTPDIHAGGTLKPITNELFLFSNVIAQGWRADINVAYRDITGRLPGGDPKTKSGWAWKTAMVNVVPKMLMAGAAAGLLGEWLRKLFEGVSEYDKSNYTIVPVGIDEKGNSVYLRLPQDDTGRFIGGLAWKAMRGDKNIGTVLTNAMDYSFGQTPGQTPSLKAIEDTFVMASGRNPYDPFRGRNLFSEEEMSAGGPENWTKFLRWQLNHLGASTYAGTLLQEKRPQEKTTAQQFLDSMIVSNVLGRWMRVSDYGVTEKLREAKAEVKSGKARLSRDERDEVTDAIQQLRQRHPQERHMGSRMALARKIVERVYPDMPRSDQSKKTMEVQKKIAVGLVRGSADPWIDEVINAGSNAEKRVVIDRARQSMSKDEFTGWLDRAAANAIISRQLSMQIKTGRPTR